MNEKAVFLCHGGKTTLDQRFVLCKWKLLAFFPWELEIAKIKFHFPQQKKLIMTECEKCILKNIRLRNLRNNRKFHGARNNILLIKKATKCQSWL